MWIKIPEPETARSERGRELLREAKQAGQMRMSAAFHTFPALGDAMADATNQAHFGETSLPNIYKELIATLVSSVNACQY